MPLWKVRDGRGKPHVLWDDARFGDVLAVMKLRRAPPFFEEPPVRGTVGASLFAGAYQLWKEATEQFQAESTALFDAVRPSIDMNGPHGDQDVRGIQAWKRGGIKDGRALIRWALSFVDRSTVEGQMDLLTEINGMSTSSLLPSVRAAWCWLTRPAWRGHRGRHSKGLGRAR